MPNLQQPLTLNKLKEPMQQPEPKASPHLKKTQTNLRKQKIPTSKTWDWDWDRNLSSLEKKEEVMSSKLLNKTN